LKHSLLQFTTTPNIHLLQLTITIYCRLLQLPIPSFEEEFTTVHYNFQYQVSKKIALACAEHAWNTGHIPPFTTAYFNDNAFTTQFAAVTTNNNCLLQLTKQHAHQVSKKIALACAEHAWNTGEASKPRPEDILAKIEASM